MSNLFNRSDDQATGIQPNIDSSHHEIHGGDHYFFNTTSNLGSAATANYFIITPNTEKKIHMKWNFASLEDTHLVVRELADGTTSTAVSSYNSDRNSTNTAGLAIVPTASITTAGTLFWQDYIPADKFGSGGTRADNEIILKKNTWYNLRIISGAASNIVTTKLFWYEHVNRMG